MANTTTNNFFPITNDKLNDISRGESFIDFAGLNYFWTLAKQYIDNGDDYATEVYTTDFEIGMLVRGRAVATRDLFDAAKAGKIIKVKDNNKTGGIILNCECLGDILVLYTIYNNTLYRFTADFSNNVETTTINATYDRITTAPDWFERSSLSPNYIANRTHYHNQYGVFSPGQRYSITDSEIIHDLNNYRLLIRGDLFKIQEGLNEITKDDITIHINCVSSESGKIMSWTLQTQSYSGFEENEYITVVSKLGDYKLLDKFYLPADTAFTYITEFNANDLEKTRVVTITQGLVDAVKNNYTILIPEVLNARYLNYIKVLNTQFSDVGGVISLTFVYFSSTIQRMVQVTVFATELPQTNGVKLKVLSLVDASEFKNINGTNVYGSGDITIKPDWNNNDTTSNNYIANRTHYAGSDNIDILIGNRFSLPYTKNEHNINSYRLLYEGNLYKLPQVTGESIKIPNDPDNWKIQLTYSGYSASGSISTFTLLSGSNKNINYIKDVDDTFKIVASHTSKKLDSFYLPEEVFCQAISISDIEALEYIE